MMTEHVFPAEDLMDHTIEGRDGHMGICRCNPRKLIYPNGYMIVTHNSYDGREIIEELNWRKEKWIQ